MSVISETSKGKTASRASESEFSVVLGGPLYQLLLRAHLIAPSMGLVQRRILAAVAVTWLPLAVLTVVRGEFASGAAVPFLYDIDVQVRFLVVLPLLIASELIVHSRLRPLVIELRERDLIAPEDRSSFDSAVVRAMQLRNSAAIELVLLILSFTAGYWIWREQASLHIASWYAISTNENGISFTWPGYWYVFVSVPILRFIILRWYFRLFIWYLFLFRVSRLHLQLNALHPDQAGGLGFLNLSIEAIAPVLVAQTTFVAGVIANQIWHEAAALPDFSVLIAGIIAFLLLIVAVPLSFFAVQLAAAKRAATREYGALATKYVSGFRLKWLRGPKGDGDKLLGSEDIQSLADFGSSYSVMNGMRLFPFEINTMLRVAIAIALPLLPLGLTMVPLDVFLRQLINLVL